MSRLTCLLLILLLACCASEPVADQLESQEPQIPITTEGIVNASEGDIMAAARRELRAFQEKKREADLYDATWSMEQSLRSQGFAHARVTFERDPDEGEITSAKFLVEEGPRVLLQPVEITVLGDGVGDVPQETLESFFDFPPQGGLFGGDEVWYRESDIGGAMSEVEKSFLLKGYYHVEVGPFEPRFTEDKASAHPLVPVVTGPRYGISITPPTGLPPEINEVLPDFSKWADEPYTVHLPTSIASAIRSALLERGHQLTEVRSVHTVPEKDTTTTVPISFEVEQGPLLHLRTANVEGYDRTDPDFILSLIDIPEGTPLGQSELDRITDRLYATALFSRVTTELDPESESGDEAPADLLVTVEELEAKSVDLELGFGSYELLRGGVRYRDRNLFGLGRIFDATLRASLKSGLAELRVTDPYTLGSDNTLVGAVGAEYRVEPSFTTQSIYGDLGVRHTIDAENSLTGGYRYQFSNVSDSDLSDPDIVDQTSTKAGLYLTLRHDSRDNPLIPNEGVLASVGTFWSTEALLADLNFLELSARAATYIPLSEFSATESADTVLAIGAAFTSRDPLGDTMGLPIQERLFLGGESSVRSFYESELGPFDEDRNPLGGLTSWEAHVELRQRLTGELFGALFYDVGVINSENYSFQGPLGHAVGVGLRYYLPVGPARLDFAINPGERFAADQSWALHFSFGFSF